MVFGGLHFRIMSCSLNIHLNALQRNGGLENGGLADLMQEKCCFSPLASHMRRKILVKNGHYQLNSLSWMHQISEIFKKLLQT